MKNLRMVSMLSSDVVDHSSELSPDQDKPKTLKLVLAASLQSTQH